ncbi:MAG TPA: hypothetical protein VGI20_01870 [Rhizomicrobium sp.]|jgi:hypothetical protein
MSGQRSDFGGQVKERSGWLVPIAVFIVTALLSAFFLAYYLAPNPSSLIEEHPQPTSHTDPTQLRIGGISFAIPANYLLYASARRGGVRREVALYAALPDFRGYSDAESQVFSENGADSPIVHLLIREEQFGIPEAVRLQRVYLNDVDDVRGRKGQFGLVQYAFREDSGYRGEDLFVGRTEGDIVVMRCVRFSVELPGPSCLRDVPLARGVAVSYRFKRSHLAKWREIAEGAGKLIASFRKSGNS